MIFSSLDKFHKSVTGAVTVGEILRLRLCLPSPCVSSAFVLIDDGCAVKRVPMYLDGVYWQADISYEKEGLYFYHFEYYNHGSDFLFQLYKGEDFEAVPAAKGPKWQQTVYLKDFTTPDSFKKGVVYQIFPDRFNIGKKDKKTVFKDRYIAKSWNEPLAFEQDTENPFRLNNDYHGGDLKGIEQKLDYIKSLGVTVIYLNPVFEAHSNHRYNTADYMKIDELLGDENDFKSLCREAHKRDIKIIFDGVFSHTGSDSVYFNLEGRYSGGACKDENSPYRDWFTFGENRDYHGWWGIKTLPEVNELSSFSDFILGKGGVLEKWIKAGADGVRLDVADELPDEFIKRIRKKLKSLDSEAMLLGEVWEDASNKESYSSRRQFLYGSELDSVMNYVFRNAIIDFVTNGDAARFRRAVYSLVENYPKCSLDCAFNMLGTHDTERILTRLGGIPADGRGRDWQSVQRLTAEQRENGKKLLKAAAAVCYTLPGIPMLYYGDEAGLTGYTDPFNRAPFPWGNEDGELTEYFKKLGQMRNDCSCLCCGEFKGIYFERGTAVYAREDSKEILLIAANASSGADSVNIGEKWNDAEVLFGNGAFGGRLELAAKDFSVLRLKK